MGDQADIVLEKENSEPVGAFFRNNPELEWDYKTKERRKKMSEENYETPTSSLTKRPETELLSAQSVAIEEVKLQVAAIKQLQQDVMIKDVHYGVVPGCGDKPTLLKAGAEKLALTFRIASDAIVEDLSKDGNIRYRVNCRGTSIVTGKFLGSGVGECSSDEDKYKWKKTYQNEFNQTAEKERRKISKYNKTTKQFYDEFQVRQNPANVGNTILKMAKKRAFVDLMLTITGASDMFAQDIEDGEDTHQTETVNPPYPSYSVGNPPVSKPVTGETLTEVISVESVTKKEGTSKTGKPFVKFTIYTIPDAGGNKQHFNTFSESFALTAKNAIDKHQVSVSFTVGQYGNDLKGIEIVEEQKKAVEDVLF